MPAMPRLRTGRRVDAAGQSGIESAGRPTEHALRQRYETRILRSVYRLRLDKVSTSSSKRSGENASSRCHTPNRSPRQRASMRVGYPARSSRKRDARHMHGPSASGSCTTRLSAGRIRRSIRMQEWTASPAARCMAPGNPLSRSASHHVGDAKNCCQRPTPVGVEAVVIPRVCDDQNRRSRDGENPELTRLDERLRLSPVPPHGRGAGVTRLVRTGRPRRHLTCLCAHLCFTSRSS